MHKCLFKKKSLVTLCLLYNTQYVVVISMELEGGKNKKNIKKNNTKCNTILHLFIITL